MSEEIYPILIIQGHPCMGCGNADSLCLEIGLRDGHQSLVCRTCINRIFDRTEGTPEGNLECNTEDN